MIALVNEAISQLVERLRAGDSRALGRAVSIVESSTGTGAAVQLLEACFPLAGHSVKIGITGAPGAGKSTLVDRLARQYRDAGKTVGVVAVDPSSPFSGGAILGDRIRFQGFAQDAGFYARSMATRGALGGLAKATADVATVIAASGKDLLFIETVGVGQDEVDIMRLADITLVVLTPGMGDDVQGLKAGILEIADIFVVNKSDREGADRLEAELRELMSLTNHPTEVEWKPEVVKTVAATGVGVAELLQASVKFQKWLSCDQRLEVRRAKQWEYRLMEMLRAELLREIRDSGLRESELKMLASQIAARAVNPYRLIPEFLAGMRSGASGTNV
jgi:LAO/AO transport system kinase